MHSIDYYGKKIREGELVAFPTETVYGLGANAFDEQAVAKIFIAKNRPADNPLIVHCFSLEEVASICSEMSDLSRRIFEKFSPGPITVLLPKGPKIPDIVTTGLPLVGVRIPNHELALEFLRAAGVPIAAPSANKSGKPSATHHTHVVKAFGSEVPNVIEGGNTTLGVESTVVIATNNERITILRQGAISKEELQSKFPLVQVIIAGHDDTRLTASPGTRYRHYAPKATIELIPVSDSIKTGQLIRKRIDEEKSVDEVAVFCTSEVAALLSKDVKIYNLGSENHLEEVARNLYGYLLDCDDQNVMKIICQSFPETGVGRTIMERLHRAAMR